MWPMWEEKAFARKVTESTVNRERRVAAAIESANGNVHAVAACWYHQLRPSTVSSYLYTVRRLMPELKQDVKLLNLLDTVKQEAGVLTLNRAVPISPTEVVRVMCTTEADMAMTVLLMWLSASRLQDLRRVAQVSAVTNGVLLQWNTLKGDRYGNRAMVKFIFIPPKLMPGVMAAAKNPVPYPEVLRAMKRTNPDLTVHSCRRGAASELSKRGHPLEQIALLTGHSRGQDNLVGVRRYVEPTVGMPEAQTQMRLSKVLWETLTEVRRDMIS